MYEPIHLGNQHWAVATSVPVKEMTAQADQLLQIIIGIAVVGLLIVAGIILFVTNHRLPPKKSRVRAIIRLQMHRR